jgi:hypothetical protein
VHHEPFLNHCGGRPCFSTDVIVCIRRARTPRLQFGVDCRSALTIVDMATEAAIFKGIAIRQPGAESPIDQTPALRGFKIVS